jgi:lipopolysaccharide biosynthesis glycosyltransferase
MTTLYSLLKNNQKYYFNVYILHNDCLKQNEIDDICNKFPLNQFNNFKIHLVDVSSIEILQAKDTMIYEDQSSVITIIQKEVLFRLFIQDLLPNADKTLYLDTDVMIRGNISKLFEIEENSLFKGYWKDGGAWINAGILLINLKLARELNITKEITNFLKENNNTDEYIINHLYKDKISKYPAGYVLHLRSHDKKEEYKSCVIVHFLTNKPFELSATIPNKVLYMEYQSYLIDFMKHRFKFRLLIMNSFIFTIFLSYKRRITHFINKRLNKNNKKVREMFNNNSYMKNKIFKYAIIKKF